MDGGYRLAIRQPVLKMSQTFLVILLGFATQAQSLICRALVADDPFNNLRCPAMGGNSI